MVLSESDVAKVLCRLYWATFVRDGWEPGVNAEEAQREAHDMLANLRLDPHQPKDRKRVAAVVCDKYVRTKGGK